MTDQHVEPTPRPWKVAGGRFIESGDHLIARVGGFVCPAGGHEQDESEANARLIVRAVNAHDDLVAAMKSAIEIIRDSYDGDPPSNPSDCQAVNVLDAALAKLENTHE